MLEILVELAFQGSRMMSALCLLAPPGEGKQPGGEGVRMSSPPDRWIFEADLYVCDAAVDMEEF